MELTSNLTICYETLNKFMNNMFLQYEKFSEFPTADDELLKNSFFAAYVDNKGEKSNVKITFEQLSNALSSGEIGTDITELKQNVETLLTWKNGDGNNGAEYIIINNQEKLEELEPTVQELSTKNTELYEWYSNTAKQSIENISSIEESISTLNEWINGKQDFDNHIKVGGGENENKSIIEISYESNKSAYRPNITITPLELSDSNVDTISFNNNVLFTSTDKTISLSSNSIVLSDGENDVLSFNSDEQTVTFGNTERKTIINGSDVEMICGSNKISPIQKVISENISNYSSSNKLIMYPGYVYSISATNKQIGIDISENAELYTGEDDGIDLFLNYELIIDTSEIPTNTLIVPQDWKWINGEEVTSEAPLILSNRIYNFAMRVEKINNTRTTFINLLYYR